MDPLSPNTGQNSQVQGVEDIILQCQGYRALDIGEASQDLRRRIHEMLGQHAIDRRWPSEAIREFQRAGNVERLIALAEECLAANHRQAARDAFIPAGATERLLELGQHALRDDDIWGARDWMSAAGRELPREEYLAAAERRLAAGHRGGACRCLLAAGEEQRAHEILNRVLDEGGCWEDGMQDVFDAAGVEMTTEDLVRCAEGITTGGPHHSVCTICLNHVMDNAFALLRRGEQEMPEDDPHRRELNERLQRIGDRCFDAECCRATATYRGYPESGGTSWNISEGILGIAANIASHLRDIERMRAIGDYCADDDPFTAVRMFSQTGDTDRVLAIGEHAWQEGNLRLALAAFSSTQPDRVIAIAERALEQGELDLAADVFQRAGRIDRLSAVGRRSIETWLTSEPSPQERDVHLSYDQRFLALQKAAETFRLANDTQGLSEMGDRWLRAGNLRLARYHFCWARNTEGLLRVAERALQSGDAKQTHNAFRDAVAVSLGLQVPDHRI